MTTSKVLLLATNNEKKRLELQAMVQGTYEVRTLKQLLLQDVPFIEDHDTFAGNARIKVNAVVAALRERKNHSDVFAVMADDSGLIVDGLDGAPGVRSARFASDANEGSGDDDNNALLLKKLQRRQCVSLAERSARYACAICCQVLLPEDAPQEGVVLNKREGGPLLIEAFGTCEGSISEDAKGCGGFGYDPYFLPAEKPGLHMAELSAAEKASISHRGKATRAVLKELAQHLS